jgi:anti-sigma B factor antagonist
MMMDPRDATRGDTMATATVSAEGRDLGLVIHVGGAIDFSNSDTLREQLLATLSSDESGLVLDLTRVTYLASSGVRLLFDVAERVHASGRQVVLVVTNDGMIGRLAALT